VLDNNNELWIGTKAGINIINNINNPKSSVRRVYGMRNQIRFFKKYVNIIGFLVLFIKSLLKFIIYLREFETIDLFKVLFLELFIGNIDLDFKIIDKYQDYTK
ncbi:MAG: hypothetical protein ACK4SU_04735, partial [Dictyoglomus sp.]